LTEVRASKIGPSELRIGEVHFMPEKKVPSNVVSDATLRGLVAKLHTGDARRRCQHLNV